MQPSVKEIVEKQENCYAKDKLELATKLNDPVQTQRVGFISGVNMKKLSEKWFQKHVKKDRNYRR